MVLLSTALTAIGNLPATIKAVVATGATAPVSPVNGTQWLDTTVNLLKVWNGSGWVASYTAPTLGWFHFTRADFNNTDYALPVDGRIWFDADTLPNSGTVVFPRNDANGKQVIWGTDAGGNALRGVIHLEDNTGIQISLSLVAGGYPNQVVGCDLNGPVLTTSFNWGNPFKALL